MVRLGPAGAQRIEQAETGEDARGIRRELQTGADLRKRGGLFEDMRGDALAGERKGRRQTANAGADDGYGFDGRHGSAGLPAVTPPPGW
ncbi:hypothetical protein NN6n1_38020 [Shinella zoogloeoides]